jgi:hypothetical protein
MTPLAPQRYGFQFTGDQETRVLYEDVRDLLSHQIPSGEMALVFKRVLEIAKAELKKRKYASTRPCGTLARSSWSASAPRQGATAGPRDATRLPSAGRLG